MLLMSFLLLPMAHWACAKYTYFDTYVVKIDRNGTLERIKPTQYKLLEDCPCDPYESYKSFDLSNLNLEDVTHHLFDRFHRLTDLNLENNVFHSLPAFIFSKLTNLRRLNLANNKITSFNKTFIGLRNLDHLNLENNKLKVLKKGYLSGIPKGTDINVNGNDLSRISTLVFRNFYELQKDSTDDNDETMSNDSESGNPSEVSTRDIRVEYCYTVSESRGYVKMRIKNLKTAKLTNGCIETIIRNNNLLLRNLNTREFKNNWEHLSYMGDNVLLTNTSVSYHNVSCITGAMLKNLPETVTTVDLTGNNFESMEEGSIENMNDLETNVTTIVFTNSGLKSTGFIANLPSSLSELNLGINDITEIATGSITKFTRLLKLHLYLNQLTVLRYKDLRDLSSLEYLDLSSNNLSYIKPNAFYNLKNLTELNLERNKLCNLPKGTFTGLNNIRILNLGWNFFTNLTDDTFFGISDTLSTVLLHSNKIRVLGVNSFVRVPTKSLSLSGNEISRIEMDAFDLPTLQVLDLESNNLNKLKHESFKGLPSLKKLSLRENGIKKIDSNIWKHLRNVEELDISKNLIRTLKNGDLCGMTNRGEGFVLVEETPINTIQGGVFFKN